MIKKFLIGFGAAAMALTAAPALADDDDRRRYRAAESERVSSRNVWRGDDGRYYCRRGNGTTGLVVGGAAGALVGRAVDGGRSRTTGTILGAAAGALLGRQVQKELRCR